MRNAAHVSYQECRSVECRQESRNQQCKRGLPVEQGIRNLHLVVHLLLLQIESFYTAILAFWLA